MEAEGQMHCLIGPTVRGTTKQGRTDGVERENVVTKSTLGRKDSALPKTCTRSIDSDAAAQLRQHQRPEYPRHHRRGSTFQSLHILRNFTRL